jgi:hypothetical protein
VVEDFLADRDDLVAGAVDRLAHRRFQFVLGHAGHTSIPSQLVARADDTEIEKR